MAVEPTPGVTGFPHSPLEQAPARQAVRRRRLRKRFSQTTGSGSSAPPAQAGKAAATPALAASILRRMSLVLPIISLACAFITYVFVVYVVPLPGAAQPAAGRRIDLIGLAVGIVVCWIVCHAWGLLVARPMTEWLGRGGDPDQSERVQTVRLPLYEARNTLAVWAVAGRTIHSTGR